MRRLLPFATLALTLSLTTATVRGADDLYSEVAVESVFGGKAKASDASTTATASATPRITGAGQLGELVRSLGYEPKRLSGKSVKVTVSHGPWTIPTTLRAAVDRGQVDLTMGLASPTKDAKLNADKLLKLLSANDGPAYFVLDQATGQLQLRQSVSARGLTAERLSRLLKEMAELAASRETSWYVKPTQPAQTTDGGVAASLPVGTWLAKLSAGEAFALGLQSTGEFALVHVKNGRTVRSGGKATRLADRLTLTATDGTAITGAITAETSRGFALTLSAGRRLTFAKAG